ncbi:MAG TPA: hypothetical protein VIM89_15680 [Mucilaginibacter sp.]
MIHALDFRTAYSQFYIIDPMVDYDAGSFNFWTAEAFNDMLAIGNGILGVGIGSYGHVKAELEMLPKNNSQNDYTKYDHVVEAGIKIESGLLQIIDCPNSEIALSIAIEPKTYRVRIYSAGLSESIPDEDEGKDYYRIEIWPDNNIERKVLKRYVYN